MEPIQCPLRRDSASGKMAVRKDPSKQGPLTDLRVIEVAQLLAPFCRLLLADFGAEVIKIEHPAEAGVIGARGPAEVSSLASE